MDHAVPDGIDEMEFIGEIDETTDIKSQCGLAVGYIGGLIIDFSAECEMFRKVVLNFPSGKNPVLIALSGIYPISSTSIRRKFVPRFLHPYGKVDLCVTVAECFVVNRRNFDNRENADLRTMLGFL